MGLGFVIGVAIGALITFRATPWLIGRLTQDERLAFARKVRAHTSRKGTP